MSLAQRSMLSGAPGLVRVATVALGGVPGRVQAGVLAGVLAGGMAVALPAWGQAANGATATAGIYSCTDAQGRRLTSDRPIPDCGAREQRVLNKDGSVQRLIPPTLTADERAEREATERRSELARAAQADAVRRDRNLVARFPNEATHRKSREAALDTVRLATKATEFRLKELAAERKPLLDEAEFFKGRPLPGRLKQQLDANDAGVDAQRQAAANQEIEKGRINQLYDLEQERLRRLWAGALPGSLPPVAMPAAAPLPTSAKAPAVPGTVRNATP